MKYQMMMKSKVPLAAVIAKMNMDKIPPTEQALLVTLPSDPTPAATPDVALSTPMKKTEVKLSRKKLSINETRF